jgi:deazaflavin-dependent oxidoreductase (nitroreductase family)
MAPYFTPSPRVLGLITRVHRDLYRATGGLLGATLFQRAEPGKGFLLRPMPMLLLTTTGRRSGEARTVPLPYFAYEGRTFLVASFAGGAKDPAWYGNLVANPEVEVQIRREVRRARATTIDGDERLRLWPMLVRDWPRYGVYQAGTRRTIPLVELH